MYLPTYIRGTYVSTPIHICMYKHMYTHNYSKYFVSKHRYRVSARVRERERAGGSGRRNKTNKVNDKMCCV